jgi:hypothetical protein
LCIDHCVVVIIIAPVKYDPKFDERASLWRLKRETTQAAAAANENKDNDGKDEEDDNNDDSDDDGDDDDSVPVYASPNRYPSEFMFSGELSVCLHATQSTSSSISSTS